MSILDRIKSPADVRALSNDEMRVLADDIRAFLIESCSVTGGHIGAGLGVVELTDRAAQLLRYPARPETRLGCRPSGLSAQSPHRPRRTHEHTAPGRRPLRISEPRTESEYDTFGAGHAATSISAGVRHGCRLAISKAKISKSSRSSAIGSLGSGLAYEEGLNNAGASGRDFIGFVLNDNEMSIAPNGGAMHKYLASVQRNPIYNRIRSAVGDDCRATRRGCSTRWRCSRNGKRV